MTVIKGELYLCGRLVVEKICDINEAAATLGDKTTDLWEANEHLIAKEATSKKFNLKVPLQLTRQLKFISGEESRPLFFKSSEQLDQQTMRGVRELTSSSAAELDKLLPALKEVPFKDNLNSLSISEEEIFPEEVASSQTYYEGATKRIKVNVYERNTQARKECILRYGTDCFVCGFNFKKFYRNIGDGFIHVHHLKPLSEVGEEYELDPIRDLRPVCPNCHAMIHRKNNPPYTIEELKELLLHDRV